MAGSWRTGRGGRMWFCISKGDEKCAEIDLLKVSKPINFTPRNNISVNVMHPRRKHDDSNLAITPRWEFRD
ncbi:hypothetical protein U1Q18_050976 [Sarracenia purpurea var. burkii]